MTDDAGRQLSLSAPAKRVVTTAPHLVEFLYAAGGGDVIVGVTAHSDYPDEARTLPVIGDNRGVDMERLLALKPDLLVLWKGGNPARLLAEWQRLGIPVFFSDVRRLEDIPDTLERLGTLVGRIEAAKRKADALRREMNRLTRTYRHRTRLSVFYQVSENPMYTVNGKHLISEALRLCGGDNIFAELPVIAPRVNLEAVLEKDPSVIFVSGRKEDGSDIRFWHAFGALTAVQRKQVYAINPDWVNRPGPRFVEGARELCRLLDLARTSSAAP
ncbi:MAG: cobalamin-binding protein [Burkholderiaceae bacterium]|nr:cobalamin-binding protein [Burkholderiaceae bacterium]